MSQPLGVETKGIGIRCMTAFKNSSKPHDGRVRADPGSQIQGFDAKYINLLLLGN